MKLAPGPFDLPVQALIGALITSPDGAEIGIVRNLRLSVHSRDEVGFLLVLNTGAEILWRDPEDYVIHLQGPSQ